ncbi:MULTISPECIES: hypothetical protein [Bradyrhizobium]|uniref:hypothetical protein n=1 Tax=Bradyrhizobium TaxID=374 RepID=UPI000D727822|nr:hypothetical protein [Bradyrhizobium diazoefficiens]AWO91947.1 hypothetical protein DI395_27895 [Bradyrhizobium diazoefficiens]
MADGVHVGENSPEQIAFKLMQAIATAEGMNLLQQNASNRAWILKTYAQCLETVRAPHLVADALAHPSFKI